MYSIVTCVVHSIQVIPTGASGTRTPAVSHPVPLSGTGDAIRPEVASKDGLVSARNGPTLAEDSTSSGHAQEGVETTEAEMRGPKRGVVRGYYSGRRGWSGDEAEAREATRRNRGASAETHTENTVQGAVLVIFILVVLNYLTPFHIF